MAQLRTIRGFIEDSGIDLCWIELANVKQIIDGNQVKRGQEAHMVYHLPERFHQEPEFLEPVFRKLQKISPRLVSKA